MSTETIPVPAPAPPESPERPYRLPVTRGIAYLEEHHPGWRKKINLARLDIADCIDCVFGQVFGSYIAGLRAAGLEVPSGYESNFCAAWDRAGDWAVFHGFAGDSEVTAEWRRQLRFTPTEGD